MKQQVDKRNNYCSFVCVCVCWKWLLWSLSFTHIYSLCLCLSRTHSLFAFSTLNMYEYVCVCVCVFGVHFSTSLSFIHSLTFFLTHFLVNVLWQCSFEVSSFVATYCSLEIHSCTPVVCSGSFNGIIIPFLPTFANSKNWHSAKTIGVRKKKQPSYLYNTGFGFQLNFIANKIRMFVVSFHFIFFLLRVFVFVCVRVCHFTFRQCMIIHSPNHLAHMSLKHTHTSHS